MYDIGMPHLYSFGNLEGCEPWYGMAKFSHKIKKHTLVMPMGHLAANQPLKNETQKTKLHLFPGRF